MIIPKYLEKEKLFGAIDDTTGELLVPCLFSKVEIQPYGIVVINNKLRYGCFSLRGEELYPANSPARIENIIFLKNDMFAFSYPKKNVVAISNFKGDFILPPEFESFLLFCGVNFKAVEFSVNPTFPQINKEPFFYDFGASISEKICVKQNDLWGVYNTFTKELEYECIYPSAEQCVDSPIILKNIAKNEIIVQK